MSDSESQSKMPIEQSNDVVSKVKKEKRVKRPQSDAQKKASENNPWFAHLREYREKNPNMSYKQAMQEASPSYKGKKAGKDEK